MEAVQVSNSNSFELIKDLRAEIERRTCETEDVRRSLSVLQAAADAAEFVFTEKLSKERAAFSETEAGLNALIAEKEALRASLSTELEEALIKLKGLEIKELSLQNLTAENTQLKLGKEEMVSKISELEIEILELKEAAEKSEDEKKSLEEKLKEAFQSSQELRDELTQKIEYLN